jgi:thiazole synthase
MATNPAPSALSITLNGEPRRAAPGSIADLVRSLDLDPAKVAVERNGAIVPRSTLADVALARATCSKSSISWAAGRTMAGQR